MENTIQELIEIEVRADEFMKKTREDYNALPDTIAARTSEIKKRIETETKAEMYKIYKEAEENAEAKAREAARKFKERLEAMEKDYEKNHSEWEEQIFRNITRCG